MIAHGRIKTIKRILSVSILTIFLASQSTPPISAQSVTPQPLLNLPNPGTLVTPSTQFVPLLVKGMIVHPDNPFQFDFILDPGEYKGNRDDVKVQTERIIRYFLASLTIPEKDLWVNLSPMEEDRIIPEELSMTEMGRDLLAQDYLLKQLTASMIYPASQVGKAFWDRVYEQAVAEFGTTQIPINTFNKVWIVPDKARVVEKDNTVFIMESHLKVMLEEDYMLLEANRNNKEAHADRTSNAEEDKINAISSRIVREIILPEIEKEVNEGANFAPLRQMYHAMILSAWYKEAVKDTLIGQLYADQTKVRGVDVSDPALKEEIYQRYMEAYKQGVFNYIKEDYDPMLQMPVPRKYFSGGFVNEVREHLERSAPTPVDMNVIRLRNEVSPFLLAPSGLRPLMSGVSTTSDAGRATVILPEELTARPIMNLMTESPVYFEEFWAARAATLPNVQDPREVNLHFSPLAGQETVSESVRRVQTAVPQLGTLTPQPIQMPDTTGMTPQEIEQTRIRLLAESREQAVNQEIGLALQARQRGQINAAEFQDFVVYTVARSFGDEVYTSGSPLAALDQTIERLHRDGAIPERFYTNQVPSFDNPHPRLTHFLEQVTREDANDDGALAALLSAAPVTDTAGIQTTVRELETRQQQLTNRIGEIRRSYQQNDNGKMVDPLPLTVPYENMTREIAAVETEIRQVSAELKDAQREYNSRTIADLEQRIRDTEQSLAVHPRTSVADQQAYSRLNTQLMNLRQQYDEAAPLMTAHLRTEALKSVFLKQLADHWSRSGPATVYVADSDRSVRPSGIAHLVNGKIVDRNGRFMRESVRSQTEEAETIETVLGDPSTNPAAWLDDPEIQPHAERFANLNLSSAVLNFANVEQVYAGQPHSPVVNQGLEETLTAFLNRNEGYFRDVKGVLDGKDDGSPGIRSPGESYIQAFVHMAFERPVQFRELILQRPQQERQTNRPVMNEWMALVGEIFANRFEGDGYMREMLARPSQIELFPDRALQQPAEVSAAKASRLSPTVRSILIQDQFSTSEARRRHTIPGSVIYQHRGETITFSMNASAVGIYNQAYLPFDGTLSDGTPIGRVQVPIIYRERSGDYADEWQIASFEDLDHLVETANFETLRARSAGWFQGRNRVDLPRPVLSQARESTVDRGRASRLDAQVEFVDEGAGFFYKIPGVVRYQTDNGALTFTIDNTYLPKPMVRGKEEYVTFNAALQDGTSVGRVLVPIGFRERITDQTNPFEIKSFEPMDDLVSNLDLDQVRRDVAQGRIPQLPRPAIREVSRPREVSQGRATTADPVGGINLDASLLNLSVERQADGINLKFDERLIHEIQTRGIDGFEPFVIEIVPLPSVVPLLGSGSSGDTMQVSQL